MATPTTKTIAGDPVLLAKARQLAAIASKQQMSPRKVGQLCRAVAAETGQPLARVRAVFRGALDAAHQAWSLEGC